jgi:glutamyl-tRNA reductase
MAVLLLDNYCEDNIIMSKLRIATGVGKEIPLFVVGYDFRNASTALREKLATTLEDRVDLFHSIKEFDQTAGLLVLETCNRSEWIVSTHRTEHISEILAAWMLEKLQQHFPNVPEIPPPYTYIEKDAVIHILRVVVGMKSLAEGEAQIARQFQLAIKRAQKENMSSPIINKLSHFAGRIAKSASKIGFRCNCRQGVHGLVLKFMKKYFQKDLPNKTILVAGMGEVGRRTVAILQEASGARVKAFNRTITPEHRSNWASLDKIKNISATADAFVVATGNLQAVFNLQDFEIDEREEKLLIMDIGVPRQVTKEVQNHPMINYCNVDHLVGYDERNELYKNADQLGKKIDEEFNQFIQFCRARGLTTLLTEIRTGQLTLTEDLVTHSLNTQLAHLKAPQKKEIANSINQLVKNYSNNLFVTFHQELEKYWNRCQI